MKKRLLSLFLAALMLLSVASLAACNKTSGDDTTAAGKTDTTAAAADTTAAEPAETTTITILAKSMNNNVNQWYRYDQNPRWASIPLVQEFYDRLEAVGVHVEWEVIDDEQYNEAVKTRLLTGVDLPDIIADPGLTDTEVANAGAAGILADVNALLDEYDEDGSVKEYMASVSGAWLAKYTDEYGRMFGFPYIYHNQFLDENGDVMEEVFFETCHAVSIREDWLEAIGEEWKMFMTPEEFSDLLIKMYEQDANGNGVSDEVIANFSTDFYTGFEAAFDMGQGLINIRNNGNGVECNLYSENLADYVAFFKNLYDAGVIDTTVLNDTNVKTANRASCLFSYTCQTWEEASIVGYESTAAYSPVIIDDDEGENGYCMPLVDGAQNVYGRTFVNAQSENLEAVAKFLDVFYTKETSEAINYGYEGVHYFVNEDGIRIPSNYYPNEATAAGLSIYDETDNPDPTLLTVRVITSGGLINIYELAKPHTQRYVSGSQNPMYQHKYDVDYYNISTAAKITSNEGAPLAAATAEELETMAALQTTIETYVDELMLALFLGEKTMDDVPVALAELEAMGLNDLIAVYEARHQRFLDVCAEQGIDSIYS